MHAVIAVALHKPGTIPIFPLYLPVQAGAAVNPNLHLTRDDTGENISARNGLYCELTAHYWLWKNVQADVYGLCHYRRYFTTKPLGRSMDCILSQRELEKALENADVIVPRPRIYLIETNASHYAHAHHPADLAALREVISEICPEYLPAHDRVMARRWGRRFNMFIMRREQFESYSAWLFGVLFPLEKRLGPDVPPRTMGFIAERLMDVWVEHHRPRIRRMRVLHTEGQHWPRRIAGFLKRKFIPAKNRKVAKK